MSGAVRDGVRGVRRTRRAPADDGGVIAMSLVGALRMQHEIAADTRLGARAAPGRLPSSQQCNKTDMLLNMRASQ